MKNGSPKPGRKRNIIKVFKSGEREEVSDTIPSERLLQIFINGCKVCTISCLPRDLGLLSVGYVINHGYVKDFYSIDIVKECQQTRDKGHLWAKIEMKAHTGEAGLPPIKEAGFLSSACGSIDEFLLENKLEKIQEKNAVSASVLLGLNKKALESQKFKKQFGGLHSATLFDYSGQTLFSCEDLGRHNCIDKIAGHLYMNQISAKGKILFTTGRISLDAVYNINRMRIPVTVTNSSVTFAAASLAEKLHMTLIGYARGGRFNIYSGREKVR